MFPSHDDPTCHGDQDTVHHYDDGVGRVVQHIVVILELPQQHHDLLQAGVEADGVVDGVVMHSEVSENTRHHHQCSDHNLSGRIIKFSEGQYFFNLRLPLKLTVCVYLFLAATATQEAHLFVRPCVRP